MASQFDIQSIVDKPTWKQMLLELIDRNRIDPWDVDIVIIADGFMKKIKEMKKLDFAIQANIILAAAILLKYKSEYLKYLTMEEQEIAAYPVEEAEIAGAVDELPQLTLVSRIPPKRQITLNELVDEMESIIKYENAERAHIPRGAISEVIDLELSQEDIEKRMNDVLERIKENTDDTGWSLFSSILPERTSTEIIYTLLALLHLTQMQTIDIKQDKFFGEIFIHLLEAKKKEEKQKIKMEIRR